MLPLVAVLPAADRRLAGVGVLVVVTLWAGNFVVSKAAIASVPPISYSALRFSLASVILIGVLRWREACVHHPAAQRRSHEELMKLYYDYSQGGGNGRIPEGRAISSFTPDVDWRTRPWPSKDKWGHAASDAELGLV